MPSPELQYLEPAHAELYEAVEAILPSVHVELVARDMVNPDEPLHVQSRCHAASFLLSRILRSQGFDAAARFNTNRRDIFLHHLARVGIQGEGYLIDSTYGQFLKVFGISSDRLPESCLIFPETQEAADMVVDWMAEIITQHWRERGIPKRTIEGRAMSVGVEELRPVLGRSYQLSYYQPLSAAQRIRFAERFGVWPGE